MPNTKYNWKRYLSPRGRPPNLSPTGLLPDPEERFGEIYNPCIRTLEQLEDAPCVIILGELGDGKSTALGDEHERLQAKFQGGMDRALRWDLNTLSNRSDLDEIFESGEFRRWRTGGGRLWLLLDSLDEYRIGEPAIAQVLCQKLRRLEPDRLRLRLCCRTADWPASVEQELGGIWEDPGIFELAPLRRRDVEVALTAEGVPKHERFFEAVRDRGLGPLVGKPVTLLFLLDYLAKERDLPLDHLELFRKGCAILCEESLKRQDIPKHAGKLSGQERIRIASRVAAATILTNRDVVHCGGSGDGELGHQTHIDDLCGEERTTCGSIQVDGAKLTETLGTGLFSSRGPRQYGWAHRGYGEFLAALYLSDGNLRPQQVLRLLVHPASDAGRIVPGLRETAAWAASMRDDLMEHMVEHDPMALLGTVAPIPRIAHRRRLAEAVLDGYGPGRLTRFDWALLDGLGKLDHPELTGQLRPFLNNESLRPEVRKVAMQIALRCKVGGLQKEAADIAVKPTAPLDLREPAAHLVAIVGGEATKAQIRPLASGAPEDVDDSLKGHALAALWPRYLTADELFEVISEPRKQQVGMPYDNFLRSLPSQLDDVALPAALQWAGRQPARVEMSYALATLMDEIVNLAWESLDLPGVLDALSKALWERARRGSDYYTHREPWKPANRPSRLRVVRACVEWMDGTQADAHRLVRALSLDSGDIPAILELAQTADLTSLKSVLASVIEAALDANTPEVFDQIRTAAAADPDFGRELHARMGAIPSSREVEELGRKQREKTAGTPLLKAAADNKMPAPSPDTLAGLLAQSGAPATWPRICDWLFNDGSGRPAWAAPDFPTFPRWRAMTASQLESITDAAKAYLTHTAPTVAQERELVYSGSPMGPGRLALALLAGREPTYFRTFTADDWARWLPAAVRLPWANFAGPDPAKDILDTAFAAASTAFIEAVRQAVLTDETQSGCETVLQRLRSRWTREVEQMLLSLAAEPGLAPDTEMEALIPLLLHGSAEGIELASRLVRNHSADNPPDLAVAAARAMIHGRADAGWEVTWPEMKRHHAFAKLLIETAGDSAEMQMLPMRLRPADKVDLYVWSCESVESPTAEVLESGVAIASSIQSLRTLILNDLLAGNREEELREIAKRLPQHPWLKGWTERASEERLRRTWSPPSAAEVLRVISDNRARLVRSEKELLDLVVDALEDIKADLHGEHGIVRFLWNKTRRERRLKSEEDISAFIAYELRKRIAQRGVVVNREVEILYERNRTDIKVSAVSRAGPDPVHVIIEAKGSWNRELNTAMEHQLVDQYMRPLGVNHGLYLVYLDPTRRTSSLGGLRELLDQKAVSLSMGGRTVQAFVLDCGLDHLDRTSHGAARAKGADG